MGSLADKVIEANERENNSSNDTAPEGYYTDDLGMWVERDIRKDAALFARYVYVRCRKLNPHLYYDNVELTLYDHHKKIEPTIRDIVDLANLADTIRPAQAIWVYNKLKETVPRLDRSRILVAPGLAWDFETARLVKITGKYYTTGGGIDE